MRRDCEYGRRNGYQKSPRVKGADIKKVIYRDRTFPKTLVGTSSGTDLGAKYGENIRTEIQA